MNETIVTCAGCGKRYKGLPSSKKMKCKSCSNLLTFPEVPRIPAPGKIWCSNCWTELNSAAGLCICPVCTQKVQFGGRAAMWAAGSSLTPSIAHSEQEIAIRLQHQHDSKLDELRNQLTREQAIRAEVTKQRDEADKLNERNLADLKRAQTELEQYRSMAVAALEPLGIDFTRRMREMMSDLDRMRAQTRQLRDETTQKFDQLDRGEAELRTRLSACCREISERLSEVLGTPVDAIEKELEQTPPPVNGAQKPMSHLANLLSQSNN